MEEFIIRYGFVAVFLGAVLEGDVTLILAGVVAHLGFLHLVLVIGVGSLGAVAADCTLYWLGRRGSARVNASKTYARAAPLIERLANRLGPWEVVLARFVYGSRLASMLFWGMRRLPWTRFVLLDTVACVLWASVLAGLGFFLSTSAAALIGDVKRVERWLLGALVGGVAIVLGLRAAGRRLRR